MKNNDIEKIENLQVYIASPLEEQNRILNASQVLKEKVKDSKTIDKIVVLNSKELEKWKDSNSCDWVDKYWFEVCSQMEMRLVEDADIFLHAGKTSSWSETVVERRISDGIGKFEWDEEVLEVIDEFYIDITKNLNEEITQVLDIVFKN